MFSLFSAQTETKSDVDSVLCPRRFLSLFVCALKSKPWITNVPKHTFFQALMCGSRNSKEYLRLTCLHILYQQGWTAPKLPYPNTYIRSKIAFSGLICSNVTQLNREIAHTCHYTDSLISEHCTCLECLCLASAFVACVVYMVHGEEHYCGDGHRSQHWNWPCCAL